MTSAIAASVSQVVEPQSIDWKSIVPSGRLGHNSIETLDSLQSIVPLVPSNMEGISFSGKGKPIVDWDNERKDNELFNWLAKCAEDHELIDRTEAVRFQSEFRRALGLA